MTGDQSRVVTVQHRGAFTADLPENSIGAFRNSYESCQAAIETDVRATKDGVPVMFHDLTTGKMLEPAYTPLTGAGPNPRISDLTLNEVKDRNLLNSRRQVTGFTVPTVAEFLDHHARSGAQTLVYLEIKDPAVVDWVLADLKAADAQYPQANLLDKVAFKFGLNFFPTYDSWNKVVTKAQLRKEPMVLPIVAPWFAPNFPPRSSLVFTADNIPSGVSAFEQAVADWAGQSRSVVPVVEVVLKDATGYINRRNIPTPQGEGYIGAASPSDASNTEAGSIPRMISIILSAGKRVGTFVAIPDYQMWRSSPLDSLTVPNNAGGTIPTPYAFYENDSTCCYDLRDKLNGAEFDQRYNIERLLQAGMTLMTSDDSGTIERYFDRSDRLERRTITKVGTPDTAMNSYLAWQLKDVLGFSWMLPSAPATKTYRVRITAMQIFGGGDGVGDQHYEIYGRLVAYSPDTSGTRQPEASAVFERDAANYLDVFYIHNDQPSEWVSVDDRGADLRASGFNPTICIGTPEGGAIKELDNTKDDIIVGGEKESCAQLVGDGSSLASRDMTDTTWSERSARIYDADGKYWVGIRYTVTPN